MSLKLLLAVSVSVLIILLISSSFGGGDDHNKSRQLETAPPTSTKNNKNNNNVEESIFTHQQHEEFTKQHSSLPPVIAASSSSFHHHQFNIIFSCFYFRSDFYTGRKVPSLDWIIVMIESAYEHRICETCSDRFKDTRLIMFVDETTKSRLESFVLKRAKEKQRPNFIENKFLELILIDEKNDEQVKRLFANENWADSTKLKNAANNFRFWFMRRYLTSSSNTFENEMKIAIVDATDVLFQRNPFETGVCFPKQNTATSSSSSFFLFTLEDTSKNFHNEIYNKRWMKCYDQQINKQDGTSEEQISPLAEMDRLRMRISCAGVSLGSYLGVLTYLSAQLNEISKPKLASCAIEVTKAALDQATHNYLMFRGAWTTSSNNKLINPWTRNLPNKETNLIVAAVPHYRQRQSTSKWKFYQSFPSSRQQQEEISWDEQNDDCVFHGNFAKLEMSQDGKTVVVAGTNKEKKYAIIHQYTSDRHPKVMKVAHERYQV